jgi:hypothetical protein
VKSAILQPEKFFQNCQNSSIFFFGTRATYFLQLLGIIGKWAIVPILHEEKQISPVLSRAQMARIGQIIRYVERHPR